MLLSAFSFTLMGVLSKVVVAATSLGVVLFVSSLTCFLCTLPKVWGYRNELFSSPQLGLMFFRGFCGFASYALLFIAIQKIPLVDAYLLNYASPLMVPIVAFFWQKIRISHRIWPGLILGFVGVIFVLKPTMEVFSLGSIYALSAAFFSALVLILLRLLAGAKASIVFFYNFLTTALISLPWAIATYEPFGLREWILLAFLSFFMFFGTLFSMKAFRYGPPTLIAPFNLTANIYAGLISWMVWGNEPNLSTILGSVGIVSGGIFTILGGRIRKNVTDK